MPAYPRTCPRAHETLTAHRTRNTRVHPRSHVRVRRYTMYQRYRNTAGWEDSFAERFAGAFGWVEAGASLQACVPWDASARALCERGDARARTCAHVCVHVCVHACECMFVCARACVSMRSSRPRAPALLLKFTFVFTYGRMGGRGRGGEGRGGPCQQAMPAGHQARPGQARLGREGRGRGGEGRGGGGECGGHR